MFVDWFKNVSAIFVDVYEIYATLASCSSLTYVSPQLASSVFFYLLRFALLWIKVGCKCYLVRLKLTINGLQV